MPSTFPLFWITLLCLVAGLSLGAAARVGSTKPIPPRCRACRYPLTGHGDDHTGPCPECGADLAKPEAIQRHSARRSAWQLGVATALVLLAVAPWSVIGVRTLVAYDWYRMRPASWLVADVTGDIDDARAWGELVRRARESDLSEAIESELFALIVGRIAQSTPRPVSGRTPWYALLDTLLADDPQRLAAFDAALGPARLAVELPEASRQGEVTSLRLKYELGHAARVHTWFRVLGVRGVGNGHAFTPGWPGGSVGRTAGWWNHHVDAGGQLEVCFVPLATTGPTDFVMLVEERRFITPVRIKPVAAGTAPVALGSRSDPIVAGDYGLFWRTRFADLVIADDEIDRLGEPIRSVLHQVPFTLDIEPARSEGSVHPSVHGGFDNFEVLAVRVSEIRRGRTTMLHAEFDVRGPRVVPVALSFTLNWLKWDQRSIGVMLVHPDEVDVPDEVRTVTLSTRISEPLPVDSAAVVATPDWGWAQRRHPEWPRIWGGHIFVPDVTIERRSE